MPTALYELPPTLRAPLVVGASFVWIEGIRDGYEAFIKVVRTFDWSAIPFAAFLPTKISFYVPIPGAGAGLRNVDFRLYADDVVQVGQRLPPILVMPDPWSLGAWQAAVSAYVAALSPSTITYGPARTPLPAIREKVAHQPPRMWPRTRSDATHCVVDGVVPGYEVLVYGPPLGGFPVAFGTADPDGVAYCELLAAPKPGHILTPRYWLPSASNGLPGVVADDPIPACEVERAWAGETGCWVGNLVPGWTVTVTQDGTLPLTGSGRADIRGRAWVVLDGTLVAGQQLTALPAGGALSAPRTVEHADACEAVLAKDQFPESKVSPARPLWLPGPLRAGDTRIRVEDLRGPVDCRVEVFQAAGLAARQFWNVPEVPDLELRGRFGPGGVVDLTIPLTAGDAVRVAFTLPDAPHASVVSGLRMVTAAIPEARAGRIFEPVLDCALAVLVTDVVAGDEVAVLADGSFVGFGVAGTGPCVRVGTPAVERGEELICCTSVGGTARVGAAVNVSAEPVLSRLPRVLPGVTIGDHRVWVSGLPPGGLVTIADAATGAVLGRAATTDPILRIQCPISVTGPVRAVVTGCDDVIDDLDLDSESAAVTGLPTLRPNRSVSSRWFEFDPTVVFTDANGQHRFWGQVWRPLPTGARPPLVVILHGNPTYDEQAADDCSGLATDPSGTPTMSYRGYDQLARALAATGCVVVSIKHDVLLDKAGFAAWALDLLMLPTADAVLGLPLGTSLVGAPTLFVGHSYGAEALGSVLGGLVKPAAWQLSQGVGFVGLAPYWGAGLPPTLSVPVLIFCGSADYLLPNEGPLEWYASGAAEKTFIYAEGLPHSSWSSVWSGRDLQTDLPDEMRGGGFQLNVTGKPAYYESVRWQPDVAAAMTDTVVAFALARLFDEVEYLALLRGPVRPERVENLGWFVDHVVPTSELSAILGTLPVPGDLDWPAAPSWTSPFLSWLPLLAPTDDLVLEVQVTQLDGGLTLLGYDQEWEQGVSGTQVVTNLELDLLVVVLDGAARAQVRLGCLTRLPGPWQGRAESVGFPQSIRVPYDAFMAVDPGLTLRPDLVVLDVDAIVADAAVIVSSLEFQRQ